MSEIRLVGTAHVSSESVDEVRREIVSFDPDIVAVELDPPRYQTLKYGAEEPEIGELLKSGNFTQLLVQWALGYVQRQIGMDVGVEPGAEMKAACEAAEERGIRIALVDRDIRVTLQRFWSSMTLLEKLRMGGALLFSVFQIGRGGGGEIDIESLKQQDVIDAALEEFRRFAPNGARALIEERDAYLAHQILGLVRTNERVLAVVGAGHVAGIRRYIDDPSALPPIEDLVRTVKPFPWLRVIEVAVTAIFIGILVLIAFSGVGVDLLVWALLYWVLLHGVLTAVFTLVAGGHPLSALTGFSVSWLTAIHPLIAAGWFSAIVEAKIRRPRKGDLKRLLEASDLSDLRKNPLFRVVFVAALANVGSTLGTVAYFALLFPALGIDPTVLISQGAANIWSILTGA
ncbi:MAG TPA: TraB/GumN family protein [Methanoregulaceae archaeon]|nr:TraB/GumN family protein [Methanoregulaceae archaeon]